MTKPEATHAYLGFLRCGHLNLMAVDDPTCDQEDRDSLADELAKYLRDGGRIERVPLEIARGSSLGCPDECPLSWKNNVVAKKARK